MAHWPRLDVNVQDVGVSQIPTDKVDRGGDRMTGSLNFAGYPLQGIPWRSWTPTWTGLSVGNGPVVARYQQVDKLVNGWLSIAFGSTTSISGSVSFSNPIGFSILYNTNANQPVGATQFKDASGGTNIGLTTILTSNRLQIQVYQADSTYLQRVNLSSSIPFTWTSSDRIHVNFQYEAA